MRITEGICAHCGVYVFWSEPEGRYLAANTRDNTCSPADEPHNVPED